MFAADPGPAGAWMDSDADPHCSSVTDRSGEHRKWGTDENKQRGPRGGGPFGGVVFGGVLLSHTLAGAVPSALEGLASGFGMGPGVSPPLWPP
jgi:hypothetical protein